MMATSHKLRNINWKDFTQNTTFHGVRQIFSDSPFRMRRILWVIFVLAAVFLFAGQVANRASTYFRYDSNVNVEVIYTDSLKFPAATVCNQNTFRVSKTAQMELYDYINDIFSANISTANANWSLPILETEELLLTTAHQKEDFIERCEWNGKPCNISRDFTTIYTDLGICFTFNDGQNSEVRHVSESGSTAGLKLILNLEQYEYMKGPQNDAGVKILLHDQTETPLMKDQGFAISPGTHAFVGIEQTQIAALEPPWGTCRQNALPVSRCMTLCKTGHVVNKCGCRDLNVEKSDEFHPVCNMSSLFTCVPTELSQMHVEGIRCDCPAPCIRTQYQPVLSYAQLSKFNVKKLMLPDNVRHEQVRQRFLHAKDVFQRVDKETRIEDHRMISDILQNLTVLPIIIKESLNILTNDSHVDESFDSRNPLLVQVDLLAFLRKKVGDRLFKTYYKFTDFSKLMNMWSNKWVIVSNNISGPYLGIYGRNSALISNLMECMQDTSNTTATISPTSEAISCRDDLDNSTLKRYHEAALDILDLNFTEINQMFHSLIIVYNNSVFSVYNNTGVDVMNVGQHISCLTLLQMVEGNLTQYAENLTVSLNLYVNESSLQKKLGIAQKEYQNLKWILRLTNQQAIISRCSWFNTYPFMISQESNSMFSEITSTSQVSTSAENSRVKMGNTSTKILENIAMTERLVSVLTSFRDDNTTKAKVSFDFHMASTVTKDLAIHCTDIIEAAKHYSKAIYNLWASSGKMLHTLINIPPIPVFSDEVIAVFPYVRYVQNVSENSTLKILMNKMEEDRNRNLVAVVNELFGSYLKLTETAESNIQQICENVVVSIDGMHDELKTYSKSLKMDTSFFMENFLMVDVFYKEMNYHSIEQQETFVFISLLGEIGGFLGLLLGASVLTVCEILDFVVLKFASRWSKRNVIEVREKS